MLTIYTDENVEIAVAEGLKRRMVNAFSVNETGNLRLSDEQQLEYAVSKKACLFSYDSDYFEISAKWIKQGKGHFGIFYTHLINTTIDECIRKLKEYSELFEIDNVKNRIIFL